MSVVCLIVEVYCSTITFCFTLVRSGRDGSGRVGCGSITAPAPQSICGCFWSTNGIKGHNGKRGMAWRQGCQVVFLSINAYLLFKFLSTRFALRAHFFLKSLSYRTSLSCNFGGLLNQLSCRFWQPPCTRLSYASSILYSVTVVV